MVEPSSTLSCKSLTQLSGVASKVVAEDVEGEDFKQLLAKCIDTLSVYKGELRKLSCVSDSTPAAQFYQLNETLYVYYKIVSQIASQVIPKLPEFQRIKNSSKKDAKDKELMEIYSRLVSALANDKRIGEVKKFIKSHSGEGGGSHESAPYVYKDGEFVSISQLHSLILNDSDMFGVLLVDIRPRMDFNEGHIKHNNIVCIEPISFKESYTDLDIMRKSLITAPEMELEFFKNRDKFKLIVLYTDTDEHTKYYWHQLEVLQDILLNRSFDKPLNNTRLIILQNGVNAWKGRYPEELDTVEATNLSEVKPKPMEHNFEQISLPNNSNKDLSISSIWNENPVKSSTHYPDAPFLTSAAGISTSGLTPNPLLPSTSNLTKALQQHDERNSEFNKLPQQGYVPNGSKINGQENATSGKLVANGNLTATNSNHPKISLDFTVGLVNLGNSCYLNCIIQCLLGCHELTYIFLTNAYKKHVNVNSRLGSKGLLAGYFSQLVQKMYQQGKLQPYGITSTGSTAVQPSQFKLACGSVNSLFKGKQQQDCQEFCQFLLDGLHEDLNQCGANPPLKELSPEAEKMRETMPMRIASAIEWERYLTTDFSVIVDLFQGQYASRLRCKMCGHTSTTYQAFSVLSVPVPKTRSCTIYDCFKEFTKLETLEKDELWYCPYCKKRQPSTKQIIITRLPNNLIIHMKRFDNMLNKNNVFVNYPNELDLTGFWINDYSGEMPKDNGVSLPLRGQKPPFNYRLFSVASHSGTLYGGHYTSYVDKGGLGWCSFDDVSCRKVRRKDEYIIPNAYVLFYHRVN
ncbi:unnamed protein product [Kluyveromyces dobzhanskii CBS 2104]|uniref:Ubiquitin carboxyl-terminal hydrolase n=1 Tax=Kluyveromyces dobzhanskii CBS 2104 TaxID=1427455 RepID=A0A0A8L900_9SACH|nr:unnamed protein product [Kluyveromyces dobzhanskii CBS 2104]